MKRIELKSTGHAEGNQGVGVQAATNLIRQHPPPVPGAPGITGLSGRASQGGAALRVNNRNVGGQQLIEGDVKQRLIVTDLSD